MRYDHIIWDWNGTLFDDTDLCVDLMADMLAKRDLGTFDVDRYHDLFTFPVRDYYERVGFDFDSEPFEDLAIEFIEGYMRDWRDYSLRSDALPVSDALHNRGLTQSILSAAEQGLLDESAAHFGLTDRMTSLVGIDDHHAVSKLAHGLAFLDRLRVPVDRVLFVGDTVHDHEVATAMGVDSALIEGGHAPRAKLQTTGAPVYASLTVLLTAIG
jgi:phosphoglycolate phosphatase